MQQQVVESPVSQHQVATLAGMLPKVTARYTDGISPYKKFLTTPQGQESARLYPNAYRGANRLAIRFSLPAVRFDTVLRLSWYGRFTENGWQGVDTARSSWFAPKWAKWVDYRTYYAGMFRNMYHLTIGKFGLSVIPLTNGDCAWWD